jgi:cellulose synthase/poly-beta-1,6-N-acetylglucosamine synthase-like glycosyltransferase
MASIIGYALLIPAGLLVVPVTVFVIEIVAAFVLTRRQLDQPKKTAERPRVCVLVPAHNEGEDLKPTLDDIKTQLGPADRLLVVADNCTDDTAAIARAAGAEVVERNQPMRFGKGFALDFGLSHLSHDLPEILIAIDADCRLASHTIDQLAMTCATTCRPVQALYLMKAPMESSVDYRVAEFAWRVKNWVRPSGLSALGLPCQLMGAGMAFPREVLRSVDLGTASIVEDLNLGLDLAKNEAAPLFCPSANVMSQFPISAASAKNQRKRWEAGHLRMIVKKIPSCIYTALAKRNLGLLVLTLDVAIPPLSLLVILLSATTLLGGTATPFGVPPAALIISAICLAATVLAVFLSWLKWGRDILPLSAILSVASYLFTKLPLYHHILSNSADPQWTRTDRNKS